MTFSYNVRVFKLQNPTGKMLAFGSVTIENMIEVKGFRIIDGSNGKFVAPPQTKGKDAEGNDKWYDDVWFPGGKDEPENPGQKFRTELFEAFLTEFNSGAGATPKPKQTEAEAQADAAGANAEAGEGGAGRKKFW
jgi:DNA-binding cell septation regulator SpoVG